MNKEVEIQKVSVKPISLHSQAVYEAGKKLLIDSVDVTREYCKHMITVSASAIPIYLALLKTFTIEIKPLIFSCLPVIFFLSSTIFFAIGLVPKRLMIAVDLVEEIEEMINNTLKYRNRFIIFGTGTYVIGVIIAIVRIFLN